MTKKHPNNPINKFKHSLASYPLEFHQYVISPKKICIQFKDVQLKTRAKQDRSDLKRSTSGTLQMPVDTQGTDIDVLAVGIPIHMYPELLKQIKTALQEHHKLHPEWSVLDEID